MIEEELGVIKNEWLDISSTVFESEFMKRRFSDVLNNLINDMILI